MSRRDGNTNEPKTVKSVLSNTEEYSSMVTELSRDLVSKYCTELDGIMSAIQDDLRTSKDIDDRRLERYILNLANILYFTGSAQEELGIREDTCRTIRQELYNKTRDSIKGTVADKNAQAENAVKEETIVLSVYSRAYKKVKLRMEAGYEMLASLKKVMNRRVSELELSNSKYIGGCGDVD